MRRVLHCVTILPLGAVLLLAAVAAAPAADWAALKPEGYVSDFARVVDPASRGQLERYCAAVKDQTGVQMALVTVRTLDGEPVEEAANKLFRAWGVGGGAQSANRDEGILLLLAVGERKSRVEVGYGLEPLIPDGFAGSILREMRPALRESHYGDAMLAAARTIGERVAAAKGIAAPLPTVTTSRPRTPESFPWKTAAPVALLVVAFIAANIAAKRSTRRRRYYGGGAGDVLPWIVLDSVLRDRHWRGHQGGGFGGYSSGGFGGFGGGDSGGGGASSDW